MKKEILMLIIGILIGAIIATGVFLVLKGNTNNGMPEGMGRGDFQNDGEMPNMDDNTTSRQNMKQDRNTTTNTSTDSTNTSET